MEKLKKTSIGQILTRAAEESPDKTAVVAGEQRETYRGLNRMAEALAASFSEIGFRKGDRVAIYMKNSIEFVAAFYALEKLGVIVVWVNPTYRKAEAQFILGNSAAKGVIVFREWQGYDYLEAVSSLRENLPDLESIILVGEGKGKNVHSFGDLLAKGYAKSFSSTDLAIEVDLAMLIYTSGTTGKPKGAMITHYQSVRAGWEYSLGVGAGSEDIFLGVLPMCHSYGCGVTLIQPILLRASLVIMDKFDPETAFQLIEKEKITLQPAAPVHYILELNHPNRKNYDLGTLRAGLIAGQIAPEGLITRIEKEMGVYVTSFWGASEVGPGLGIICPYPSPLEIREKYIGKSISDTQIRIVDPYTRKELPDGEVGELTLKGWHVLKGYWRNPEETKNQIVNHWLHMGDLVSREDGGYLNIYGRTKDLINRGGYKIYPYELESVLSGHPKIEELCVVGTPNPVLGESICLCVVPKQGEVVSLDEIRRFLEGKIAPYKLPDELCMMRSFPRLSGGLKLNKFGKGGIAELARGDESRDRFRH